MNTVTWLLVVHTLWTCSVNGRWSSWHRVTIKLCSSFCNRQVLLSRNCNRGNSSGPSCVEGNCNHGNSSRPLCAGGNCNRGNYSGLLCAGGNCNHGNSSTHGNSSDLLCAGGICTRDSVCNGSQSKWITERCTGQKCRRRTDRQLAAQVNKRVASLENTSIAIGAVVMCLVAMTTLVLMVSRYRRKARRNRRAGDRERIIDSDSDLSYSSSDHEFCKVSVISAAKIDIFRQREPAGFNEPQFVSINPAIADKFPININLED